MEAKALETYRYLCTLEIAGRGFDAEECSTAIGLRPTNVWRQTREWLRRREDLADTVWSFEQSYEGNGDTGDVVDRFLAQFSGHAKRIRHHADLKGLSVDVVLTVRLKESADEPVLRIHPRSAAALAELNADLTINLLRD